MIFSIAAMTAQNFLKHQWQHRILVIQFDEVNQQNYTAQLHDLRINNSGLTERKLIVYQFCDDQYRMGIDKESEWRKADPLILEEIKKDADMDFSILLIGLDGGIKLRQSKALTTEELFRIIDSMPMRAREIRESQRKNK